MSRRIVLIVLLAASLLVAACTDEDAEPVDGDVPTDGDAPDGDDPLCRDGDTELAADGCNICTCYGGSWSCTGRVCEDGDDPDGDDGDGDTSDGDDPDGDDSEGDTTDGDDPDGDDSDGDDSDGDDTDGDEEEVPQGWQRLAVSIDDPVVTGTSLMAPVDGISFAYNGQRREFITQFNHDLFDPEQVFLWRLDEMTGVHHKVGLSGAPLAADTNFCMGEDWCQFIGYDPLGDEYVVFGPRSPAMMRVGMDHTASQSALSGSRPPNGAIAYSHLFAWEIDRLFVYGYITGSGFSSILFELSLSDGQWSEALTGLPQVFDNCLAYDPQQDKLYSFGGLETDDGGETSSAFGQVTVISRGDGSLVSLPLPAELAPRQGASCAIDVENRLAYVFGGAVIHDHWDERQNEYHNDLWRMDLLSGDWEQVIPDGPLGSFEPYGGDFWFVADPNLPNFGKNRGRMELDGLRRRLILTGEVPRSANQLYLLHLASLPGWGERR